MKRVIIMSILALLIASCNHSIDYSENIKKLDANDKFLMLRIDSLKLQIENLKKQSTSDIPVFIGMNVKQIKDYWSTKVSIIYFQEGSLTTTHEKDFAIQEEGTIKPKFWAIFDKNGLCKSHMTQISYDDISIMQARLTHTGYIYSKACNCWQLKGANHKWTVKNYLGNNYEFWCEKL